MPWLCTSLSSCALCASSNCRLRPLVQLLEPRDASVAELELFHTPEHVRFVQERSQSGSSGWLDGGDPSLRGVEAAACVVGSSLRATEWIMGAPRRRAFVPIAGLHHATRERAAGFCVFNDCGVVIEHLRRAHGIQRIAYVDIDAHHGDGVYYAFEADPELIFADLHQSGESLYPGTGAAHEPAATPRSAPSSMCRYRPERVMSSSPSNGHDSWRTWRSSSRNF